jgi:hypothetical protein
MTSRCALDDAASPHDQESFCHQARSARGMPRSGVIAPRAGAQPALGRFIWQLVGVDDTYGSICLIGTKV